MLPWQAPHPGGHPQRHALDHNNSTQQPRKIWVLVDPGVDLHLKTRPAELPLNKALKSSLAIQALGLFRPFQGMHPQDALDFTKQNLRILMKQERTKGWVRLLPWAVITMNSQESSSTGYTPHELFHGGRPAWSFRTPLPEDYKSPVGDCLEHRQNLANLARANLKHLRERE